MRKFFHLFLIVISFIFFHGCFITKTPGFYSGYSRLSNEKKGKVNFINDSLKIRNEIDNNKINAVNGYQLKALMNDTSKSLVYYWNPFCSGEFCLPLDVVNNYCQKNSYALFIVADYYTGAIKKLKGQGYFKSDVPVFSVNEHHYETRYCNKYKRLFLIDLLGKQEKAVIEKHCRYYLFKKDEFIKCVSNFPS